MITIVNEKAKGDNMQKEAVAITAAEWEVMRVVWTQGQTTSKQIAGYLQEALGWKAATTKTLIGRLVDKQALKAKKDGRHYLYSSLISEDERLDYAMQDVFSHVCAKKKGYYLNEMLAGLTLTQEDIADLMQTLKDKQLDAPQEVACKCAEGQCDCKLASKEKILK